MKTIQSIDRTMCILDYVSQHNGQATLTEISRSLNLAITTIHGLLSTLEMWSMLTKDSAGRYSLGCKLFQLSLYCQTQQKLLFLLQPPMRRLAEELGESVHLGLAMGDSLVYADRAEPQIPFRQTATVGETVPYYDSAIGLII